MSRRKQSNPKPLKATTHLPWIAFKNYVKQTKSPAFKEQEHAVWLPKAKYRLNATGLFQCLSCLGKMDTVYYARGDEETIMPGMCMEKEEIRRMTGLLNGTYFCNAAQCMDWYTEETYQVSDLLCTEVDEGGWNEGEDGNKGNPTENKLQEEESGSPQSSSESNSDNQSPPEGEGSEGHSHITKVEIEESPCIKTEKHSDDESSSHPQEEIKKPSKSGNSNKGENRKGSHMGQSDITGRRGRSRSQSRASDLGEFGEVETSETDEGDDRRKSHRERNEGVSSRSRTPELPGSEMNGSISSQQILQGLPYLHLLPPSIRNDAARLLFMPQILPGELPAPSPTPPGPSSHSSSVNNNNSTDKNSSGDNNRSGPGYFCKPCNIKFSSARTLDAHQTYYCSFRRDLGKDGETDGDSKTEQMTSPLIGSKKREREADEDRELTAEESMEIANVGRSANDSSDMNPNKAPKTGKQYSCMYCSYSADKKVSLNRHMRMHSGPPLTSVQTSNSNDEPAAGSGSTTPNTLNSGSNIGMNKNLPEGVNALERYCQDCDIQFSSIKTFRVHKQYYCRTRHVLKPGVAPATGSPTPISMKTQPSIELGSGITVTPVRKCSSSPVPSEGSPVSTPGPMPSQPFVVLPTSPIIIVPYCYIQAASILPGNLLPSQNALVVLPNGAVQGLPFTSIPMPIPSPSPVSQSGGMGSYMQSNFSAGSSVKNNGVGTSSDAVNRSSVSPTSQSHSIFNDPKDILRKIPSVSKTSSQNTDSLSNESGGSGSAGNIYKNGTIGISHSSIHTEATHLENGSSSFKEKLKAGISDEHLDENHDRNSVTGTGSDENTPAIDLTLRRTQSKREVSGDDEKENREVCLRLQSHNVRDQLHDSHTGDVNIGRRMPSGTSLSEFHRERELSSPSERLSIGSGSCGKRTPRPSSTSISSSCSTPPALCEPKVNGMMSRLSPAAVDHDIVAGNVNTKNHAMMTMMMSPAVNLGDISMKKGSVDFSNFDIGKHKGLTGEPRGKRAKMSPITTQLPGGAILTSTSSQSLTDLLMSNSSELSESLAKINPQLLINARSASGSPLGINPAIIHALSQADPEIVMRIFDPLYLTNLQQTIQQQQQQQQQQHQQQQQIPVKRGYSKCVECDIVFYKHENYLVHKEHYCAARMASTSPNSNKISEKENQSSRGMKDHLTAVPSRVSSCSSPAKSEIDGEECLSPPTHVAHRKSSINSHPQLNVRLPRKSTDSSSSDFFPQPIYDISSKNKSRSPQTIPASVSISPVPSPKDGKENSKEKQIGSQYPCLQCGVQYSTMDNLKAHQSFYCTKRRNKNEVNSIDTEDLPGVKINEDSDLKNNQSISGTVVLNNKGLLRCGKCKLAIPEDQLSSHSRVCLGSNGSIQHPSNSGALLITGGEGRNVGLKCPCCDTYSPTTSAAQKHLEIHTGIRAFKCLLCGYRGNTLRGMRTHIRTHFDKRVSDLLEGEYMTCITANEVEHSNTSPSLASNKSHSSIPEARTLDLNHRNETTNRVRTERNKLTHSPTTNITNAVTTTTSSPNSPQESPDVKVFAMSGSGGSVTEMDKLENNNRLCCCTLCNYTSSYRGNVIRHMKLVHKISEESADKILNDMNLMKINSSSELEDFNDTMDHKLQDGLGSTKNAIGSRGFSNSSSPSCERKEVNGSDDKDERSENDQDRNYSAGSGRSSSCTSAEEDVGGLSSLQKKEKPCAVKYCKSCDIYFNNLSTFDAHKKLYCSSALNNETAERAETPVQ